ncbi:hypothetical protein AB0L70_20360 [Kribbella sp. NPDC051952]|uniref:hypothetical protein n=1 Tax=Kribbella sp. NPDC051952 TaxID=3154851 RepID=UPI003445A933
MNPTDEVDDLLTRAGARWRADQPSAPEPDLDQLVNGRRRPRRWVPALAAASVAAIAAAALTVLPDGSGQSAATPPGGSEQAFAPSNQTPNDDLLVKPGDKVRVSGRVVAAPGKPAVFCAPLAVNAIGYPPGQEPAPSCPAEFAVTLRGVDLARLTGARVTKGVRTGTATLTGIWGADRSIDVQEQAAPTEVVQTPLPELPCPPPAGGWVSKPSNVSSPAVQAFLDAHADQLMGPVVYYPNGTARNAPVVIMIGVAHGDLAALRSAFEQVYAGNLCMTPVLLSRGDTDRISNAFQQLSDRKDLGIYMTGGSGMTGGPMPISLLAYTETVKTALNPIGLDLLNLVPSVKPVR